MKGLQERFREAEKIKREIRRQGVYIRNLIYVLTSAKGRLQKLKDDLLFLTGSKNEK